MAQMMMGAFKDPAQADKALYELEEHGYTPEEISVISKTNKYDVHGPSTGTQVAKSAGAGATTGGVIGGLAGLLAGVGVMPVIAGFFIGGPIAAALGLAGAAAATVSGAVTGATAGGLIGALTGLGLSKETATSYNDIVEDGGVLIGLTGRDEITGEARTILEKHGASGVSVVDMRSEGKTEDTGTAERADTQERASDSIRSTTSAQPAFGEQIDPRR